MRHSVTNRIVVGKIIGLVAGLLVFLLAPIMGVAIDLRFGLGLILFYMMTGVLIAFVGLFDRHPILKFKLPWWLGGIVIGAGMHIMLVLLAHDQIALMLQQMELVALSSPWWAIFDGIILGLIMAFAEMKLAGKGNLPLE